MTQRFSPAEQGRMASGLIEQELADARTSTSADTRFSPAERPEERPAAALPSLAPDLVPSGEPA